MSSPIPTLYGQPVFGDPAQLRANVFTGTAAQEDAFLGLTPGTTKYNPCESGGALAVTGVLTGSTRAAVQAAQQALAGLADGSGPALLPTGLSYAGFDPWAAVWFSSGDIAFSPAGIVAGPVGYQIAFAMVLHHSGGWVD
jgi:hypothetical protein